MKAQLQHVSLWALAAAAVLTMAACQSDNGDDIDTIIEPEENNIVFDSLGTASWLNYNRMSRADFDRQVVGKLWQCDHVYQIRYEDAKVSVTELADLAEVPTTHYYFDKDSVSRYYYGKANNGAYHVLVETRDPYTYKEEDNGVYVDGMRVLQIQPDNQRPLNYLFTIQYIGQRSDGQRIYGASTFRPSTNEEAAVIRPTLTLPGGGDSTRPASLSQ